MTGQQLRNSILQEAIQGRLVPNVLQPGEKTGAELLQDILAERQKKENEENGKKAKKLSLSIIEEEPWELPEGWCWCKLCDIADIERGGNFQKSDFVASGYPCIHYGQIHMKLGPRTFNVLSYLPVELAAKQRKAHTGDIVMAVTSENIEDVCKCTAWLGNGDVAIGAHTAIIRHNIDPVFLTYYFKSSLFYTQKKELGHGSKVVEVTPVTLNGIIAPLPPLSIQKAIVSKIEELLPIVDEYDKAAGELKALNETLPDKLRKSVLQEAIHGNLVPNDIPEGEATAPELLQQILKERQDRENKEKGKKAKKLTLSTIDEEPWELPDGWCWCCLGDLFEIVRGGSPRPIKDFITSDENGYNWIKIGDTDKGGKYITSANEKIIREGLKKTRLVHAGDLLLTNSMSFGRPYILKIDGCIHDGWLVLSPYIKNLDKEFIFYLLSSPYVYEVFSIKAAGGVVNNLKTEKVFDTIVPLPPLPVQHRIVEKIEELFSAINTL